MVAVLLLSNVLAADINLNNLDVIKFTLEEGKSKTIGFNQKEYSLLSNSVSETEVKLDINNLTISINKESAVDADLNSDGKTDISITYLANVEKTATLEVKKVGVVKEEIGDTTEKSPLKFNSKTVIGAIIIVILILIALSAVRKTKNPEKLYRKAESLHKEAQEFHEDGDEETASELYEKAESLRERARELENK